MRVMTRIRYTLLELSLANNILYESVIMCGYAEKTSSVIFLRNWPRSSNRC